MKTCRRIDHDGLRTRPVTRGHFHGVTPALEALDHIPRHRALDGQRVGYPLMVEARRTDGFLGIHAVVHDVQDREQGRGDDAWPPGLPDTRNGIPPRSTIVGVMLESGRLPGATAFAPRTSTSPNAFGTSGAMEKSSIS